MASRPASERSSLLRKNGVGIAPYFGLLFGFLLLRSQARLDHEGHSFIMQSPSLLEKFGRFSFATLSSVISQGVLSMGGRVSICFLSSSRRSCPFSSIFFLMVLYPSCTYREYSLHRRSLVPLWHWSCSGTGRLFSL